MLQMSPLSCRANNIFSKKTDPFHRERHYIDDLEAMPPSKRPDASADGFPPHTPSAEVREDDPLRQLFRRHANHFTGARARLIHRRLKDRLFTDLPADDVAD